MSVRRKIFKTQHFQRQVKKYSEHCCVPLCTASSKFNGYLSFHGFPVHTELRRRWLVNIRRDHFTISSHTKVCSRHFTPDQLVEPRSTEGRRRLVRGAVPLLFRWNGYSIQTPSDSPVSPRHLIKEHDYCAAPEPAPLGVCCAENEALSRAVEELRNRLQSFASSQRLFDSTAESGPFKQFVMESAEVQLSPFRTSHSQLCGDVRTETCTDSDRGTPGRVGQIDTVNHQKHIKKEDTENEGSLCGATSSAMGDITLVDAQKAVIKEEPEDEDYLCEETSSPVEHSSPADEPNEEFQIMLVKEEESEDEEPNDVSKVFTCRWCSLSYTSQIYLHKHIRRCHIKEYEKLIISGEIKYQMATRSSKSQQTVSGTLNSEYG